jgi:hypothetical protein
MGIANMAGLSYRPQILYEGASKIGGVSPKGFGLAGAITVAVAAMGMLGGDSLRNDGLDKMGYGYDPKTGRAVKKNFGGEPNTGFRDETGIGYMVVLKIESSTPQSNGYIVSNDPYIEGVTQNQPQGLTTRFRAPVYAPLNFSYTFKSDENVLYWVVGGRPNNIPAYNVTNVSIAAVVRVDGQPSTGGGVAKSPSGYTGNDGNSDSDKRNRQIAPPPVGNRPSDISGGGFAAGIGGISVGAGSSTTGTGTANSEQRDGGYKGFMPPPPPDTKKPPAIEPPPNALKPPAKPRVPTPKDPVKPPIKTPDEIKKEQEKKKEEEKKVAPPPPVVTPPPVDPVIAGLMGVVATIAANTTPQEQVKNAKTGSCQTLNDPKCTSGMEGRIKDPINANIDSNKVMSASILGNQATQNAAIAGIATEQAVHKGLLASIVAKLGDVFKFAGSLYNNQFVQSSINYLTLATTLHNAAMLSRDIGETLGEVVDNGMSLAGRKFKDSEGNDVQFTELVGNNAKALLANVLGAERYAQLTLKWQKASAIFNTGASILSTTQSMLDPLSSAIEYGMENVSKLGNALKDDGVVSESAYPKMDETIRARRANRFARLTDTLEGAENITSNLASITSDAVSIKEDWKQLREDKKELTNRLEALKTTDEAAIAKIKADIPVFTPISLAPVPDDE